MEEALNGINETSSIFAGGRVSPLVRSTFFIKTRNTSNWATKIKPWDTSQKKIELPKTNSTRLLRIEQTKESKKRNWTVS